MSIAVLTAAQRQARLNRDAGLPRENYDTDVLPGDELDIERVEPETVERFLAIVTKTVDHGHYRTISFRRLDVEAEETTLLPETPRSDWGIVLCRVVRRRPRKKPEPETCPLCLAWYNDRKGERVCPKCRAKP
jgi:hypothetical protein